MALIWYQFHLINESNGINHHMIFENYVNMFNNFSNLEWLVLLSRVPEIDVCSLNSCDLICSKKMIQNDYFFQMSLKISAKLKLVEIQKPGKNAITLYVL